MTRAPERAKVAAALAFCGHDVEAAARRSGATVQRVLDVQAHLEKVNYEPERVTAPARPKPARRRELQPCGTYGAFVRHYKRGEPIDDLCRDAIREYRRAKSRERRAKAQDAA